MPEHNTGQMGGTMRLGKRTTVFNTPDSTIRQLYGNHEQIEERHRHRYEVNPKLIDQFEAEGMRFVGRDTENVRMEVMELSGHPFYTAVQYHPEYISRPMRPSAPYLGLILASTGRLQTFLSTANQNLPARPVHRGAGFFIPEPCTVVREHWRVVGAIWRVLVPIALIPRATIY